MRAQNLSLKCYQPPKLLTYFERGFRFCHTGKKKSVGQVLQSYRPSNFENASDMVCLEPVSQAFAPTLFEMAEAIDFLLRPPII